MSIALYIRIFFYFTTTDKFLSFVIAPWVVALVKWLTRTVFYRLQYETEGLPRQKNSVIIVTAK